MEKANVILKNVGRCTFHLSLEFSRYGSKGFDIKPNTTFNVTQYEYEYLLNQHPTIFTRGFLQLVPTESSENLEVVKSNNIFTEEEIVNIVESKSNVVAKKIKNVDDTRVLKEMLNKAISLERPKTVIDTIVKRIDEVSDTILL